MRVLIEEQKREMKLVRRISYPLGTRWGPCSSPLLTRPLVRSLQRTNEASISPTAVRSASPNGSAEGERKNLPNSSGALLPVLLLHWK